MGLESLGKGKIKRIIFRNNFINGVADGSELKTTGKQKIKLGDLELDINELERDVIDYNIVNWVRDKVVSKLADELMKRHGKEILDDVDINVKALRNKVHKQMADAIIKKWVEDYEKRERGWQ